MSHPLIETFARLNQIAPYIHVHFGETTDPAWFTMREWVEPEGDLFDHILQKIRVARHTHDKPYLANAMVDNTWLTMMASLGCLYLAQRFPVLAHDHVQYRLNDHIYVDTVTFKTAHFYALDDDEDREHADCVGTFATFDELRNLARQQIEAHVAPLILLTHEKTKMGKRALWSSVADRCATLIITALKLMGQSQQTTEEVARFLVEGSPLKGKTGVMVVEKNGQTEPFLLRGACCLSYKLDYGYCRTCPLLSIAERQEKLREVMG